MEFRVVPVGRGDRPARRPRGAATPGRLASREAAATRPASSAPPRRGAGSRLWPRGAATPAGQQGGRGDAASKQGRRRAGAPDRGCEGRGQGDLDREVG